MPNEQMTPEQAAEMRAQLAAFESQQREAENAARAEKMAPLRAIVDGPEFADIATGLRGLLPGFMGDEPLFPMIKALTDIMPQLKEWAAK